MLLSPNFNMEIPNTDDSQNWITVLYRQVVHEAELKRAESLKAEDHIYDIDQAYADGEEPTPELVRFTVASIIKYLRGR